MKGTDTITRGLAIGGTVLASLPIVATVVLSAIGSIASGELRVDWLMPAELFPTVVVGGLVLLVAALRADSRRRLVAWGLGVAVGTLVASQALAVVTGLASGRTQPTGVAWALVVAGIAVYSLAVIEIAVAGVLLIRDVFRRGAPA